MSNLKDCYEPCSAETLDMRIERNNPMSCTLSLSLLPLQVISLCLPFAIIYVGNAQPEVQALQSLISGMLLDAAVPTSPSGSIMSSSTPIILALSTCLSKASIALTTFTCRVSVLEIADEEQSGMCLSE